MCMYLYVRVCVLVPIRVSVGVLLCSCNNEILRTTGDRKTWDQRKIKE